MTVHVTIHEARGVDAANGRAVVRGRRISDSDALTIGGSADSTVASPSSPPVQIARIATTTTACRVQIGAAATAASEYWPAGRIDDVVIDAGQIVSVIQV